MNVDLLNQVAFEIEFNDRFDMSNWGDYGDVVHDCETVACIAGWTAGVVGRRCLETHQVVDIARDALGLTEEQADELFLGMPGVWDVVSDSPMFATAVQAAKLLRMIATGEATFKCDEVAS